MRVSCLVTGAAMRRRAARRIRGTRLDDMLVDMVAVRMMEVAVMQVVDMIAVADGGMATSLIMPMRMSGVCRVSGGRHEWSPLSLRRTWVPLGLRGRGMRESV